MAKESQFDIAIVGAGIVGLSTAVKLIEKHPSRNICLIEKEPSVAIHQTGNNSGVIHSGIYYKPNSLKAKNCREGVKELISFCEKYGIPYTLSGKLVVAVDETELSRLKELFERGIANQVPDLRLIDQDEMAEIEPNVHGIQAIHSPLTGVVDYKAVAKKMQEVFESKGGRTYFDHKVLKIEERRKRCIVHTDEGEILSSIIINCAGLYSDRIAETVQKNIGVKIVPFRGEYYTLGEKASEKIRSLIYPVPDPKFPFLGVHFTRGISGEVEAGPNAVLAFAREGYKKTDFNLKDSLDSLTYPGFWKLVLHYWKMGATEQIRSLIKPLFVKALQRMVPSIQNEDLKSGGAGVRAQALKSDGNLVDDFYIIETRQTIHILNAPSPAATASLAIGRQIADCINNRFSI